MTAEQKTSIAVFFDTAGDFLLDGYKRPPREYHFTDNEQASLIEQKALATQYSDSQEAQPAAVFQEKNDTIPEEHTTDSLEAIAAEIRVCTGCSLHNTRTLAVPGEGVDRPLVLVVGEGPGADEDASGRPFVGKAGQLLDRMLSAVGLSRSHNCFIINVVKCRPPDNRDPLPEEAAACSSFLLRQINLLKPLVILCVGRVAAQRLLNTSESLKKLRGIFTDYSGLLLLPTYHPSALLRDDSLKRPAWEDLKLLRTKLAELDESYAIHTAEGS